MKNSEGVSKKQTNLFILTGSQWVMHGHVYPLPKSVDPLCHKACQQIHVQPFDTPMLTPFVCEISNQNNNINEDNKETTLNQNLLD